MEKQFREVAASMSMRMRCWKFLEIYEINNCVLMLIQSLVLQKKENGQDRSKPIGKTKDRIGGKTRAS